MKNDIYVWDKIVRFFHWSLVLAFIITYLSGDELELVHAYAGYYIIGLIGVRIVWGIIGSRYARFSQFIYSPATVKRYVKNLFSNQPDEKEYLGHNPAGGWMVIALLLSILATSYSGLKTYGLEGHGPLASISVQQQIQANHFIKVSNDDDHDEENEEDEFWEDIHEFLANFTVLLIFLHISGVIFSSIKHRQNLIKAMITGYKKQNS